MHSFVNNMLLNVLAAVVAFGLLLANPFNLDWSMRITLALVIIAIGYECGKWVDLKGLKPRADGGQAAAGVRNGIAPRFLAYAIDGCLLIGTVFEDTAPKRWRLNWSSDGADAAKDQQIAAYQTRINAMEREASVARWNNIPVQCALRVLSKLDRTQIKALPKTIFVMSSAQSTQVPAGQCSPHNRLCDREGCRTQQSSMGASASPRTVS